jgi:hypothetical protein
MGKFFLLRVADISDVNELLKNLEMHMELVHTKLEDVLTSMRRGKRLGSEITSTPNVAKERRIFCTQIL